MCLTSGHTPASAHLMVSVHASSSWLCLRKLYYLVNKSPLKYFHNRLMMVNTIRFFMTKRSLQSSNMGLLPLTNLPSATEPSVWLPHPLEPPPLWDMICMICIIPTMDSNQPSTPTCLCKVGPVRRKVTSSVRLLCSFGWFGLSLWSLNPWVSWKA